MTELDNQETESTEVTETTENNETLSLRDALKQNMEAMQESEEKSEDFEEEEFEEESTEEVEEDEEVEASEEVEEIEIKAPHSWKKEDKEFFNNLDPEVQEILSKYEKSRTSDYTRKTQELADKRKELEGYTEITEPYEADFKRLGIKPAEYFNNLMQIDISLSKDPKGTLKGLVDKFGVTADDLGFTVTESDSEDDDDYYMTDSEKLLKKEIKELKRQVADNDRRVSKNDETLQVERELKAADQMIQQFREETDDDGNTKYPYFDNDKVQDDMHKMIKSGVCSTLEEAYKRSPEVRLLELEESNKETPQEKTNRKKRAIAKAKKAGRSVKTSNADKDVNISKLSTRDHLKLNLEAAGMKL